MRTIWKINANILLFKSKCFDLRKGDWLSVNRRETSAMQESRLRWHWKNSHKHNCTYQQIWKGEVTASGCLEPRGNSVKSLVVNERVRMECLPKWVPLQEHMSHPKRIWLAGFNLRVTTAAGNACPSRPSIPMRRRLVKGWLDTGHLQQEGRAELSDRRRHSTCHRIQYHSRALS